MEMTLHHKRTARQQADRVKATTEVIDGIDAYENNLRRIGSTGEGRSLPPSRRLPPSP